MIYKTCSFQACTNLATRKDKRCDEHPKRENKPSATARGYGADHQAARLLVLQHYPVCAICGLAPSTQADHYPTPLPDLLAQGIDPNQVHLMRGLCQSCHSRHGSKMGKPATA